MSKPYKLRDGNGQGGDVGALRDTRGTYSSPGKSNPRPTQVYPGQQANPVPTTPSLHRDVMPARSAQKVLGPATPTPKATRLK